MSALYLIEARQGRSTVGWIRHYGGERPHAEIVTSLATATPHATHPSTHPTWTWLVAWARERKVEAVAVEMVPKKEVSDG